jgi:dihydroflavonol-4-reductase
MDLVTGSSGFVGRHVVRALLAQGRRVRGLDLRPGQEEEGFECVQGSVTCGETVRRALRGVDRVYHLAADPNLWRPDKRAFFEINVEGTRRVLEEARRQGVERVVYTSTESILKNFRSSERHYLITEHERPLLPREVPGPYCRSKLMAEQLALRFAQEGLPLVVVNPTLPIGPGDESLTPPTRMLLKFLNREHPAYLECDLNMIDVRDVAAGHLLAMEKGCAGERYILAGHNLQMSRILEELENLAGIPMPRRRVPYPLALAVALVSECVSDWITRRPPCAPLSGVRLARSGMAFDGTKARVKLGLPVRPFQESLREAVAWYRERGWLKQAEPSALRAFPAAGEMPPAAVPE